MRGRWVIAAASVASGLLLFLAYAAQARTMAATSESSAQALQAWDMLHGNVLLRGWTLSDVTFYTTELPEYMLVELARGLTGGVVHVAAAFTYALLVVLVGLLAAGREAGRDAGRERLVRLLVAVGIMLAPALRPGTYLLLSAPDHIGTQVPLLTTWLILDRVRARWVPVVIGMLLAWAQIADPQVLYEGVLPLAVVCAARMYRRRGPLAGQWYELSLTAAALGSVVAARIALALIRQAGGFTTRTLLVSFSTADGLSAQLWHRAQGVLQVFGADFLGLPFGPSVLVELIRLVGVALVGWAVVAAVRRFYRESDLIVPVLVMAFMVVLAGYLVTNKGAVNEVVGLLPVGAVLAGRVLGGRLLRAGLVPALAAVLACYIGILATDAARPPARSEDQLAASWLEAHRLTYGLAGYWEASSVTADSGNRVRVRPVRMFDHELVTTPWETDASWYIPQRHDARFVIWAPRTNCVNVCLSIADLRRQFGPPAMTYRVGRYRVLVWRKNLLTNVKTLSWCGYAWAWSSPARPCSGRATQPAGKMADASAQREAAVTGGAGPLLSIWPGRRRARGTEVHGRRQAGFPPEGRNEGADRLISDLARHVADRLATGEGRDGGLQPEQAAPAAERQASVGRERAG